jgi:single-strand DNA-binding protein
MSHTIVAKLNKSARVHTGANGTTFFVSLGEKNYDFKLKTNVYTNYDAALFAKDGQVGFYTSALVEGAIVSVSGTGLILDLSNTQYPKLSVQDAKLGFVHSPDGPAPSQNQQAPRQQQQQQQQQAPQQQQQAQYAQAPAPQYAPQQPASQQAPQQQQQAPTSWGNPPQG